MRKTVPHEYREWDSLSRVAPMSLGFDQNAYCFFNITKSIHVADRTTAMMEDLT